MLKNRNGNNWAIYLECIVEESKKVDVFYRLYVRAFCQCLNNSIIEAIGFL